MDLVPGCLDRLFEALGPVLAPHEGPPRRAWSHAELSAGDGQVDLSLAARGEPHKALEPQEVAERARALLASERRVQALRVEGCPRSVDERRDAILDRLGGVLVLARLCEPLRVLLRLSELEARLSQQHCWLKLAVLGAHDLRRR
eukprot:6127165-Prymnesium_polylepis.3